MGSTQGIYDMYIVEKFRTMSTKVEINSKPNRGFANENQGEETK